MRDGDDVIVTMVEPSHVTVARRLATDLRISHTARGIALFVAGADDGLSADALRLGMSPAAFRAAIEELKQAGYERDGVIDDEPSEVADVVCQ